MYLFIFTNRQGTGLREKVKAKEQLILNAQKSYLKDEELEFLRNNLAEARIEEEKAQATARYVFHHQPHAVVTVIRFWITKTAVLEHISLSSSIL